MKRRHQSTEWRLLAALCSAMLAVVAFPLDAAAETAPTKTVFQNVRILTMTDVGRLENAQATVEDGRITAVERIRDVTKTRNDRGPAKNIIKGANTA